MKGILRLSKAVRNQQFIHLYGLDSSAQPSIIGCIVDRGSDWHSQGWMRHDHSSKASTAVQTVLASKIIR